MESNSSNTTWNKNTIYALGLYRLIIQSLGIWPLKYHDIFSRMRLAFVVFSQSLMAISLLSEINLDCGAVNDIIQMSCLAACNVLVISKTFFIYRSRTEMFEILSTAIEEWHFVTDSATFKVMKRNATLGRRVCILQMTSAYLTVALIALGSLPFLIPQTNETMSENVTIAPFQPLPLRTACLYGEMSTSFYVIIYAFQVIQLLVTCTANVGCDCFFFGITLHIAGQFETLFYEYEHFCVNTSNDDCRKNLTILIEKHQKYLSFANYIEKTFSLILLFQLSMNIFQIVMNGMQMLISFKTGDVASIISIIIIYFILNIQIFLYCYAGDRLTSEIENLRSAVYFSSWYKLSPKLNKNVIFIMFKASKAFNLTAGKILHMDIDNFKNIFKATFSYFSFLRAMID